MNLETKLAVLKSHQDWKCLNKHEILAEHANEWNINGLSNLKFRILSRDNSHLNTEIVRVDVLLNDHWSDLVCGVDDNQLRFTIDKLKEKFLQSQIIT
jgi:hypothetical protein